MLLKFGRTSRVVWLFTLGRPRLSFRLVTIVWIPMGLICLVLSEGSRKVIWVVVWHCSEIVFIIKYLNTKFWSLFMSTFGSVQSFKLELFGLSKWLRFCQFQPFRRIIEASLHIFICIGLILSLVNFTTLWAFKRKWRRTPAVPTTISLSIPITRYIITTF